MDMEYSLPGLDALAKGARFDARMTFAMELLKSPGFVDASATAENVVKAALDLSGELFSQAKVREWLQPLSTDAEITAAEHAHIVRNARAQVLGQVAGNEALREAQRTMSPVLVPSAGRPN